MKYQLRVRVIERLTAARMMLGSSFTLEEEKIVRTLFVAMASALLVSTTASAATVNVIAGGITKTVPANINGGGSYETTINARTSGVNHLVGSFTETYSLTVSGATFDYDLTWTGGGGNLHNFNSPTFSYGIDNAGGSDNNALDDGPNAESISFTVSNINQTGGAPQIITFDGFTGLGVFFSTQVSDAGAITDGLSDLWSYDGALGTNPATNADPVGVKVLGSSSDDSLYSWIGFKAYAHAQVDISASLPQTMVYEVRQASNTSDTNRVRLNNVGVQFTVIPEPASAALLALCFVFGIRRR